MKNENLKSDLQYKREQEKKIIRKRLKIVKSWNRSSLVPGKHPCEIEPHRLAKYNLNCGCKMCHYYKYLGNRKGRKKFSEVKKQVGHEEIISTCKCKKS